MTFWIATWCTTSLSDLTVDCLKRGVGACDFAMLAENIDLPEE
jgi:hypothetical protein